ncbi:plexin domain-containing protein 2-like isoform X2 [Lytechinus variegatus]|uniref:plexin domain-containing protein 2-like isoform X2 n=1 Tax=Lytechinus variegatus TaxID=7654 RepID=UPI001BB2A20E|nr:plexin domain-containing protein 2-like isoform X2 [Lytechinus variegatus]
MARISLCTAILSLCLVLNLCEGLDDQPVYKSVNRAWWTNLLIADVQVNTEENVPNVAMRYRRQTPSNTSEMPVDTVTIEDDHDYYTSNFYSDGQEYFQNLEMGSPYTVVDVHDALSDSHLTAGEVRLPFQFPFYGHNITKIYIATGGFLSLSTFFHQYLSATQYIAPLMGNFDPSLNASSRIKYGYNDTAFTVEWDDLHVQHKAAVGRFTFQTTLISDGRILFAYKKIPEDVNNIGGGNGHKVTVGLSDGYYIDEPLYPGSHLVRRTIYHYHNILLNKTLVMTNATFILQPLKTCNLYTNCSGCLSIREEIRFDCGWCGKIKRCSSGLDRHRQDWIEADCSEEAQEECYNQNFLAQAAIVIVIVIVVVIVFFLMGCLIYAYRNPSSRSGQQLVQFQQRVRHMARRNPRDNYEESIVGNMQETKPTPPPAYTPPQDSPSIPTPAMSDTPSVITTTGAPGATTLSGNGDVAADSEPKVDTGIDPHTQMAEC